MKTLPKLKGACNYRTTYKRHTRELYKPMCVIKTREKQNKMTHPKTRTKTKQKSQKSSMV
jgi:hypothetical protein